MKGVKYELVKPSEGSNGDTEVLYPHTHTFKSKLLKHRCLLALLTLMSLVVALSLSKRGQVGRESPGSGIPGSEQEGSEGETAPEGLYAANLQKREVARYSKGKRGFVNLNIKRKGIRRKNKQDLDQVRFGHCASDSGNWKQGKPFNGLYIPTALEYENVTYYAEVEHRYTADRFKIEIQRSTCESEHPRIKDARVSIERYGPFRTSGGWNSNGAYIGGMMSERTRDKTIYVLGRLFAPVAKNGTLLSYPPLNSHHAHSAPYGSSEMSLRNVPSTTVDLRRYSASNNILAAGYTDSLCKDEEGGKDCLLSQLEDGYGYRVVNSSGFHTYFEIGDLRPAGSPALEFYVDCVYIYTYKPRIETTWLHIGAPVVGLGWQTYMFPLDYHTNMIYFKYTNHFLGNGELRNFIMHAHMKFLDSIYVFKGIHAFHYLQNYTRARNGVLPYIFECHKQDADAAKDEILTALQAVNGVDLVCEGTKPGLTYHCDHSRKPPSCGFFPRRMELLCKERVRMLSKESLLVVAFNRLRQTSTHPISRKSKPSKLAAYSPFGMGYAGHQHTVIRTDFTSDRARKGLMKPGTGIADLDVKTGAYAPPTLFVRQLLSQDKDPRRMVHKCAANISFGLNGPTWFDLIHWNSR